MVSSLAQVKIDAAALSFEEREGLVAYLCELNDLPLSAEWVAEIERRIKEVDDGVADMIPAEEFFAKLRAELHQKKA